MKYQKNDIRNALHNGASRVTFTKVDGTTRNMICTLDERYIPAKKLPKNSDQQASDDVCRVYDLEKNDWRTFRFESVKKVTYVHNWV